MRRLFLDCDGVLADFDKAAIAIFGMHPRKFEDTYGSRHFWNTLRCEPDFYASLEPMPRARELYNAVQQFNPTILTGQPQGGWAEEQKLRWRDIHFPGVPMIVCESKYKCDYGRAGDVLVDDWTKYKDSWEQMGGRFIHFSSEGGQRALPKVLRAIREAML